MRAGVLLSGRPRTWPRRVRLRHQLAVGLEQRLREEHPIGSIVPVGQQQIARDRTRAIEEPSCVGRQLFTAALENRAQHAVHAVNEAIDIGFDRAGQWERLQPVAHLLPLEEESCIEAKKRRGRAVLSRELVGSFDLPAPAVGFPPNILVILRRAKSLPTVDQP